jgi:hypothetical protein
MGKYQMNEDLKDIYDIKPYMFNGWGFAVIDDYNFSHCIVF